MKYSLAKALAEAGYPQPEEIKWPQRWCLKRNHGVKTHMKISDRVSRELAAELRLRGKAFYAPTVDEMLKTLNALHGGSEEFNLSYFDNAATLVWEGDGARLMSSGANCKQALAKMWINIAGRRKPKLREELIRVTALAQAGHSFTDRTDEINKDLPSFKLKNKSNDGEGE